jgi:alpha-tubulin suppressor-like RCC1 family protein
MKTTIKTLAIAILSIMVFACKKEKMTEITQTPFTTKPQIAYGNGFSLHLTDSGKLYGVGFNSAGQLGIGSDVSEPCLKYVRRNIKKIACGGYHSFFITRG